MCAPVRHIRFTVLVAMACALFAVFAAPIAAHADGFSMPSVSIHATVEADGMLSVTETRQFEFNDDVNGVYWTILQGENNQGVATSLAITSVSVDDASGSRDFTPVTYANNGDEGVYEVSDGAGATQLKVYTPHADGETATVTVRYTYGGAVMAWADTAELYWRFVGESWDEASGNVTLTVDFAGAADAPEPVKDGFRAWAHGPLTGTVTPHRDAKTVDFQVPSVHSGEFAEVRIAFPTAWVPGLSAASEARMNTILDEEQTWADEANARRERARQLIGGLIVAQAAVPALFAAIMVLFKLKNPKPKPLFTDTYFRDVPSDDHPAVIAAFMNNGTVGDEAIVSTLMKLTDDRVVTLKPTHRTETVLFGREKTEDDYVLRVSAGKADSVEDNIDRAALDLYFAGCLWRTEDKGTAVGTSDANAVRYRSCTFSGLQDYAKDCPDSYSEAMDEFKGQVSAAYERRNLVASTGVGYAAASITLGVLLGIGLVASLIFIVQDSYSLVPFITFFIGVACLIVGMLAGCRMRRYTQEGAELHTKCAALKHWLEDFTRLGEAVPGDLILWNRLLVMAVALGVSEEVLRQLADAVPDAMRGTEDGGYYYPVYWWCYGHHGMISPAASLHQAYTASASALAASSNSSAGGFGGGFSGGGGGGVGGGGGGTF